MLRILFPRKPGDAERVVAEVAGGSGDLKQDLHTSMKGAKADVPARTAIARDRFCA
jgi:hypothetical protein